MKNPVLNLAFATLIATVFNFQGANAHNNSQVVNTTIQKGKIYPLVNLPVAEVSASGILRQKTYESSKPDLFFDNSSKIVMMVKHNGEYMPGVLLKEAQVIALRTQKPASYGATKTFKGFLGFMFAKIAHFFLFH